MASDLDHFLTHTDLLDCQGGVEHRLTLLIDGKVRITRASGIIVIDPATGLVEPPHAVIPDHVLHATAELAGRPIHIGHRHT
jgi:hypothetical protein